MSHSAPDLHLVQSTPDAPAPDPMIGQTLDGRYAVERVLGSGGMGLVYQARHVMLGKLLAIKVLKQEVSRDEQVMARFRREAQSASAIGSQHICDVSDFGTLPDGSTYFVMEYLDGPSLTGAMERERPMQTERIVRVGQQLCDALGAAHERGIIHRDLKPDNVHLVRHGQRDDFVKVLDFGIAKVGGAADKKLTQAGQVFGTPHYMSPEQCAGREVDHRTDIYALGVMLYEMATGQVPFDADNLMGVLTKHVYEQPIPPRDLPPPVHVPAGLEAVILKCLTKQADDRYQSMAELRADLDLVAQGTTPHAVMQGLHASSTPAAQSGYPPPVAVGVPVEVEAPRRTGLIIAALAGLLLLGGGVFAAVFFIALSGDEPVAQADIDTAPEPTPAPEPPVADPPADPPPVAVAEPTPPEPAEPAPPLTTRLLTDPSGAEVYTADGALIGNTPLDMPRPAAGESTVVSMRMPGYQDRSLTVSALTASEVTVRLERARVASSGRRPPPRAALPTPTPQPLAPGPSRPAPRPRGGGGMGSEIIDPF